MKRLLLSSLAVLCAFSAGAQVFRATLQPDGQITTTELPGPPAARVADSIEIAPLPNFPRKVGAGFLKNQRSGALADLTGDSIPEVIVNSGNRLHVFDGDGNLVWDRAMTGGAVSPPAVADLDGDGALEVVAASSFQGSLYVLDAAGNDLPGWPKSFSGNFPLILSPVVVDLDGDDTLEIMINRRTTSAVPDTVLIYRFDGSRYGAIPVPGFLGVTPSVADLDGNDTLDIVVASTDSMFAFTQFGERLPGWPFQPDSVKFSYQAPMLADLDGDGDLEITSAAHNSPQFFVLEHDGTYADGWPFLVDENTFTAPTVADFTGEGDYRLFFGRKPFNPPGETSDVVYGFDAAGELLSGFPVARTGGLEGFISIADVDDDGEFEIICGSDIFENLPDAEGDTVDFGFVHAYNLDGTEVPGFPLRPRGLTFLNGVHLDDINGDGTMDLVGISYNLTFSPSDSTYVFAYDLGVPYSPEKVLFSTFKGDNTRTGVAPAFEVVTSLPSRPTDWRAAVYPNPTPGRSTVAVSLPQPTRVRAEVFSLTGQRVAVLFDGPATAGEHRWALAAEAWPAGVYVVKISTPTAVRSVRMVR